MKQRRIRILFVISELSNGGAERSVSTILRHLDRSRFEPGLLLWRDVRDYDIPEDVPVWIAEKHNPSQVLKAARQTIRVVDSLRPDIVYSHTDYLSFVTGAALFFAKHRTKWIYCCHNNVQIMIPAPARSLYRFVFRNADKVQAVSHGVRSTYLQVFNAPDHKVEAIYNPVDFDRIDTELKGRTPARNTVPIILAVGRLAKEKDYPTMFRAMAVVLKHFPAKLVVLGSGPEKESLIALAKNLGILESIEFKGFVKNPYRFYSDADVFVLSSKTESLSFALVEAMAAGTPCVSTRCPGPDEIIEDNAKGLLTPVGDERKLAEAIKKFLKDPESARRMGSSGRISVRSRFSVTNQMPMLESLFSRVSGDAS